MIRLSAPPAVLFPCFAAILFVPLAVAVAGDQPAEPVPMRVGIIGLDTSHSIAFTKVLNDPEARPDVSHCRVVAAYPHGSPDIESSTSRIPKYTAEIRQLGVQIVSSIDELLEQVDCVLLGVQIVSSIDELLEQVDCVLLETNDGRPHREQVIPVLKAGKRVFIDKPMAASLADVLAIFRASRHHNVPLFSASSLRYGKNSQAVRAGSIGQVTFCQTHSPCHIEKTHPDLFWYGIHGVESLFTIMGTGCQTVRRLNTEEGTIKVEGTWLNGRTGVFV